MKRTLSLILAIIFIFGIFSSSSYALNEKIDYVNVKVGRDRGLDEKIRIAEYNKKPLALYDSNKKEIHNLGKNSMIDLVYNSETDEIDIYNWAGGFLLSMDPESGNYIASSEKNASIVTVNNRSYRGYIYLVKNSNKVDVINHLKLQEYLYGVVPREMPTWNTPVESLKAQAVAARTYAAMNMGKHSSSGYNLCDTVHCQVYGGFHIRDNIGESANSNRAVDETNNKVITHNGKMVSTHYHSNSGGHTESVEYVWSNPLAYEVGKKDPYSLNTIDSTWENTFSISDIESKLRTAGHDVGTLENIKVADRTPSGRANNLNLIGSSGEKKIKATEFRTLIGSTLVRSTWFDIQFIEGSLEGSVSIIDRLGNIISRKLSGLSVIGGDKRVTKIRGPVVVIGANGQKNTLGQGIPAQIKLTGKGYGHGAGMSQRGAMEMGRQGKSYEEILKFYYTGIQIQSINQ